MLRICVHFVPTAFILRIKTGVYVSGCLAQFESSCVPNASVVNTPRGFVVVAANGWIRSGAPITVAGKHRIEVEAVRREDELWDYFGLTCRLAVPKPTVPIFSWLYEFYIQ